MQLKLAAAHETKQVPAIGVLEKSIDSEVSRLLALDTDKDGKVSAAEAAKARVFDGYGNQAAHTRQLLALDTTSRGVLSLANY